MKMLGLCYICSRPAIQQCIIRHRPVCPAHITKGGMCIRCYDAIIGKIPETDRKRMS